jgi:hypothetical protein
LRLSQLAWCGEGCFDSRRRVNSDVGFLLLESTREGNAYLMKPQLISATLGFTGLVIGGWITLFAHGGTRDDVASFGRTLALAGAIIIAGALVGYAIRSNSGKR